MLTYLGVKSPSMSTPISRSGRSRTWPTDASTMKSLPRKFFSVLVLAGDSTIISDLRMGFSLVQQTGSDRQTAGVCRNLALCYLRLRSLSSRRRGGKGVPVAVAERRLQEESLSLVDRHVAGAGVDREGAVAAADRPADESIGAARLLCG